MLNQIQANIVKFVSQRRVTEDAINASKKK